jgi:DNA polymerase (family 10)
MHGMAGERDEILAHLRELAELTVLDEQNPQSFRARAYEHAINGLSACGDEVARMSKAELEKIEGVGKSTAEKIRELLDTGKIAKLEALRARYPPAYVALSRIPGLGPKRLARLHAELGIANVDDLRKAIESQRLRELSGFGAKTEDTLRRAIERLGMTGKERRTPIADALPIARRVVAALAGVPGVERAEYCGSLRRLRETIGDIDIVVSSTRPAPAMEAFVGLPMVTEVLARGDTKTSVLTQGGLQIDLRVVAPAQFGAAILYFTGSKSHNIKLRQRALGRGLTLNEYGLADVESGAIRASKTEEDIYRALDLEWIPPPMREDSGEIERCAEGTLPRAPALDEIRGDLHMHTTLSGDGRSPLEDMVAQAHARGYEYLAITDHGEDLVMNGVSRAQLAEQREELARLQERYPELRLLQGCELNIGPKGGLDYDADFRMQLDWCVAAVHSHFDLGQADQTRRVIKAMEDPAVNVIGHLSGRYIGRRPGIELDIDAVLEAAAATGTAIEINSALDRLDVSAEVLRRAHELGVLFLIDTDAHHVSEFERMQWGCLQAARGWLPRERVLNTWPRQTFLAWARKKRKHG